MRKNCNCDVCIVGGGAAGMAAAISIKLKKPKVDVLILEKNDSTGRKIRATGNGRCNITNQSAAKYREVLKFLWDAGISVRLYDNDLVYPYSESAADVADMLALRAKMLGVRVIVNAEVTDVGKGGATVGAGQEKGRVNVSGGRRGSKGENDFFAIKAKIDCGDGTYDRLMVRASVCVIATGGKAGPNFGSTGDGFRFARELGHTVVRPVPVLTGVECAGDSPELIAGIRARGVVNLYKDGERIFHEYGEIQFTKYGLSGICVFNMTRHMRFDEGRGIDEFTIGINLCPEIDLDGLLEDQRERGFSDEEALMTLLKPKLVKYVLSRGGDLKKTIYDLRFRPTGVRGWKDAQCTSGGVALDELTENHQSKLVPGLFFIGEVTDYDGPCGGYNLTNAWAGGVEAAEDIAEMID